VKKNVMANEITRIGGLKYFPSPFTLEGLLCSKSYYVMFAFMLAHSTCHVFILSLFCFGFPFFFGIHVGRSRYTIVNE
jgi:hypothetical protein